MGNWLRIFRRRRDREDFSGFTTLVATPVTEAVFAAGADTTVEMPAPAFLMIRGDAPIGEADFEITTGDGTTINNRATLAGEAAPLGYVEEGETITITHALGSTFSGFVEVGVRDPSGRIAVIAELTCP